MDWTRTLGMADIGLDTGDALKPTDETKRPVWVCDFCDEKGHVEEDCKHRKMAVKIHEDLDKCTSRPVPCAYCTVTGHSETECRFKANADRVHEKWKNGEGGCDGCGRRKDHRPGCLEVLRKLRAQDSKNPHGDRDNGWGNNNNNDWGTSSVDDGWGDVEEYDEGPGLKPVHEDNVSWATNPNQDDGPKTGWGRPYVSWANGESSCGHRDEVSSTETVSQNRRWGKTMYTPDSTENEENEYEGNSWGTGRGPETPLRAFRKTEPDIRKGPFPYGTMSGGGWSAPERSVTTSPGSAAGRSHPDRPGPSLKALVDSSKLREERMKQLDELSVARKQYAARAGEGSAGIKKGQRANERESAMQASGRAGW